MRARECNNKSIICLKRMKIYIREHTPISMLSTLVYVRVKTNAYYVSHVVRRLTCCGHSDCCGNVVFGEFARQEILKMYFIRFFFSCVSISFELTIFHLSLPNLTEKRTNRLERYKMTGVWNGKSQLVTARVSRKTVSERCETGTRPERRNTRRQPENVALAHSRQTMR